MMEKKTQGFTQPCKQMNKRSQELLGMQLKIPNVNILIDQQSVGMVLLGRITKSFLS